MHRTQLASHSVTSFMLGPVLALLLCESLAAQDASETFTWSSDVLSPICITHPQQATCPSPPEATGPVTLSFAARGDFDDRSEHIVVNINGLPVGKVFVSGPRFCPGSDDYDQLVMSAQEFNTLVDGMDCVIDMVPTRTVNSCCGPGTRISVSIEYDYDDGPPPLLTVRADEFPLVQTLYQDETRTIVGALTITNAGERPADWVLRESDQSVAASSMGASTYGQGDDVPWFEGVPDAGSSSPGDASTIDVTFNSTGLPDGYADDGSFIIESPGARIVLIDGDGSPVAEYDDWLPLDVGINIVYNLPPDCSNAYAEPDCLWPPNHKLVPVRILGVTDPDGDPIDIHIDPNDPNTGVTCDEDPAMAPGAGGPIHAPDAVVEMTSTDLNGHTDIALLRAERSGTGNGRVYEIHFIARDSRGGECRGSVQVKVPRSMGKGCEALDDGQVYDATSEGEAESGTEVALTPELEDGRASEYENTRGSYDPDDDNRTGRDADSQVAIGMDANREATGTFRCGNGVEQALPLLLVGAVICSFISQRMRGMRW